MGGSSYRWCPVAGIVVSLCALPAIVGAQSPSASVENGEWPVYGGNLAQHHYSPLDQHHGPELRRSRGCLDLQDRQTRHAARVQTGRHTLDRWPNAVRGAGWHLRRCVATIDL